MTFKIAIHNAEFGSAGGINTYSLRLQKYLSKLEDVSVDMFINKCKSNPDLISVQYEPGCLPPQKLHNLLNTYSCPVVVTAHHTNGLNQFYPLIDGIVLHDEGQTKEKPWSYTIIPHPALVYPKKDKIELRKKYGLPIDKKIVGTMGFICGTGKVLPMSVYNILSNLKDDEFLYLVTSFWKGGDFGRLAEINKVVKELKKENQFRIDTDFISDEEVLNEKMQCCDLMYAWNNVTEHTPGGQSGSAADMYGARVKLIVKDCPHYSFIGKQDKVVVGRQKINEFIEDVLNTLRTADLNDVQNPEWLSWQNQVETYLSYFKEVACI